MVFNKNHFSKQVCGTRDRSRPPPLHGKCHLKFPFWFFEPFPYLQSEGELKKKTEEEFCIHVKDFFRLARTHLVNLVQWYDHHIIVVSFWRWSSPSLWRCHCKCSRRGRWLHVPPSCALNNFEKSIPQLLQCHCWCMTRVGRSRMCRSHSYRSEDNLRQAAKPGMRSISS